MRRDLILPGNTLIGLIVKNKKDIRYTAPRVISCQEVEFEGHSILAASVVEFIAGTNTIEQDVDQVDITDNIFNHDWE